MNSVIFFLLLVYSLSIQAQTPTWNEWFKQKKTQRKYLVRQIAALQVYLEHLKRGYEIVDRGLSAIGDIKNGTFSLDKDYFNSLQQVSPVVRKSPKVNDILVYQQVIIHEFKSLVSFSHRSNLFTPEEIDYIKSVYQGVLSQGNTSIDELTIATTAHNAKMTDDERLLRLDKVHTDLLDQYTFTRDFVAGTKILAVQRAQEKREVEWLRVLSSKS